MSQYDGLVTASFLDAFKHSGVQTTSISISGTLLASQQKTFTAATITATDIDYLQVLFDNSRKHSGKYRSLNLNKSTNILETTMSSELTAALEIEIDSSTVILKAILLNPYSSNVALQSTTLNFRLTPYEGTTS